MLIANLLVACSPEKNQAPVAFCDIDAAYEPDPVRKPGWHEGHKDHYERYIDPNATGRVV